MEATKGAGAPLKPAIRFPFGTCFECGDAGHWRRECPKVAGGSEYPLDNYEHVLVAGEGVEMLNVSTPTSFIRALGDNGVRRSPSV